MELFRDLVAPNLAGENVLIPPDVDFHALQRRPDGPNFFSVVPGVREKNETHRDKDYRKAARLIH
ncbi:MAG: hypothetical protein ACK55F_25505 [Acidobacteriota bacterium]|jgi:hypothetical protein